jgi:hypothetical protein
MNIRRIVLFGLFLILLPIAITTLKTNQPLQKTASNANFLNDYKKQLEQEEARIWSGFEKVGITKDEFEELKEYAQKTIDASFKQEASTISVATINLINTVCKDMNYTKPFNILSFSDSSTCAQSTSKTLSINEKDFLQLPRDAQKWVIAHEITHMIHLDSINNMVLEKLIVDKKLTDNDQIKKLRANYFLMQENRADFTAASINPEYAQGFYSFMQFEAKHYIDVINSDHPQIAQRLENAHLLKLALLSDAEKNNSLEQNIKQQDSKGIHYV